MNGSGTFTGAFGSLALSPLPGGEGEERMARAYNEDGINGVVDIEPHRLDVADVIRRSLFAHVDLTNLISLEDGAEKNERRSHEYNQCKQCDHVLTEVSFGPSSNFERGHVLDIFD